jgi:hypothetical protein
MKFVRYFILVSIFSVFTEYIYAQSETRSNLNLNWETYGPVNVSGRFRH